MNIYERCVRRPVATLMGILVVMMIGVVSLPRLPIDFLPNIERNVISVRTVYTGAGPQEVERLITEPIERTVSTINNVTKVSSQSSEGQSSVRIEFSWGTKMDEAMNDVRDRMSQVQGQLPTEANVPVLNKFDTSMIPVLTLTTTGGMSPVDLKDYVDNDLRYRFEQIPGVASVDTSGGQTREIRVDVNADKLAALGISINTVTQQISNENRDIPGGYVNRGASEFLVRSKGEFANVEDIKKIIVAYKSGVPVYVRDVANVFDGVAERRQDTRLMGKNGVLISIRKQSGENTVKVADSVKKAAAEINKTLPPGMKIDVMFDTSTTVRQSISELRREGIIGAIIALLVLFMFLRDIRSISIIAVSIPFSMMCTFIVVYFAGMSINIMSLGGLTLAVGMIVDDAIVMLENIHRHRVSGEAPMDAAIIGAGEVIAPVASSTFTTICVFAPLIFIGGMNGIFFKELGVTVTVSLIASLIVSMTLVPMLCSRFLKAEKRDTGKTVKALEERGMYAIYGKLLRTALRHRVATLLLIAGIFAAGIFALKSQIGSEYLPHIDEGQVSVNVEVPAGTRFDLLSAEMVRLGKIIRESVPELKSMYSQAGVGGGYGGGGSANAGSFRILLVPDNERKRSDIEVANSLRKVLMEATADTSDKVWVQPSGSILQRLLGGGQSQLEIDVLGHDFQTGDQLAKQVSDIITQTKGASNPRISRTPGAPEIDITVDKEKAGELGLSPGTVGDTVNTALEGAIASEFRRAGNEYDIRVRLAPQDREYLDQLGDVLISAPSMPPVPLRNLAVLKQESGPVEIDRQNQERMIEVTATYTGEVASGKVNQEIMNKVDQLKIPLGFSVMASGDEADRQQAFKDMLLAFILAVALVYMVMAIQFESILHPLLILSTVPFGLFGVFLALFVTGTNLSLMAYLGIIMLVGIVVKNAILLIDFINRMRREGMPIDEAVVTAGRLRLRPILMTTLATVIALVPMAIGGSGSEMQSPLGRVVVGGLSIGTLLTLFFIPCLYALVEGFLDNHRKRRAARAAVVDAEAEGE